MMRAVRATRFGGPEVLQPCTQPVPEPRGGEALVHLEYAGVNYSDVYRRMGRIREGHAPGLAPPYVPGSEAAGVIEATGERVVYGQMNIGSYAEVAAVPEWRLVRVPPGIDARTAAAAYVQGSTAYYLSHWVRAIRPGDTCLVQAGAGGVGQLLVQFAKHAGATVYATAGSDAKAAFVSDLGADRVFRYEDFREGVIEATGGAGVDVVYDGVGRDTIADSIRATKRRGLCVMFGVASGPVETVSTLALAEAGSIFFTRPQLRHYLGTRAEIDVCARALFDAILAGRLRITIDREFPLEAAAAAHRALESRTALGKILLNLRKDTA